MRKAILTALLALGCTLASAESLFGQTITWDSLSLMANGRRITLVMGEIHYSRVPEQHWARELKKMKEGGITMVATYCFWNHIEEIEGQFDWSGQRNLRKFIEACRDAELPVVLRIGPFCHGEVRCGGIPDWMFTKGCKMRSEDATFLKYARRLYENVYAQVEGLQWKDGGPLIAVQFDNEYRGRASYLMALKRMANEIGFDLPFYTRTGWPQLATPVPFGEMLPLYGDYSDGFWDRDTTEGCGNYWQAFHFKPYRMPTATATEQLPQADSKQPAATSYPFFTCEQGGGMASSYHRRIWIDPTDVYSSALVKLGCGSNLLGYYMYHGGTNPDGKRTTLNECQRTPATNYNDMPIKTYDFQAPLGEFGQRNESYYKLRTLHLFLEDFGEMLAPMQAHYPQAGIPMAKADDSHLRWTYRTDGSTAFIFINNYERFADLSEKRGVRCTVNNEQFPLPTIPAATSCILPCNLRCGDLLLRFATAQPVARRGNRYYFMQVPGIEAAFTIGDQTKTYARFSAKKPIIVQGSTEIYLLDERDAQRLFLEKEKPTKAKALKYSKVKEAGPLRTITIGAQRVAEEPDDDDFLQAATYTIFLPKTLQGLLTVNYRGDVARLYADGRLIDDNFYNGRPFQYDLSLLPDGCRQLELRILPLQADAPIYIPRQGKFPFASAKAVERVEAITLVR